ncbi:MAG: hypothetical protein C0623_02865 [Desulfuromonas sp.]|nr:MAG: hypothetical protein C0623_02865 [Desulfuromonas sp.]
MLTVILITALLASTLLLVCMATAEVPSGLARATFAVHCYDVGASALEGKPGVASDQRGWSGAREVDRVVYDPEAVSLDQLESWLKKTDTYIGTLKHSRPNEPKKETKQ